MSNSNPQGIRCAHCKGRHATVAALKVCARQHNEAKAEEAYAEAEAKAEWEAERRQMRMLETNMEQAEETAAEAAMEEWTVGSAGFNARWAAYKDEFAQREAEQEREAYLAEMARDEALGLV